MRERLAAVSVDLDEIPCYSAIHGLEPPSEGAARAIYRRALPRLVELFDSLGVPSSFFAIGADIDEENALRLRELAERGHEIGNHTLSHRYDLTELSREAMVAEVRGGADRIEAACGHRPVGFRAPGYTITDTLFSVLADEGVGYDSSVFPCPAYYGAKAAAIAWIRARGRQSHSVLDHPRVLSCPADPYRVGRPYPRRGEGVMELPVGVTRGARLPYIGTSVVLAGPLGARALTRGIIGRPLVNLELHGIDLADADEDDLAFLRPHQPDLRRRVADKRAALVAAISGLERAGYRFVTLAEAAEHFASRPS